MQNTSYKSRSGFTPLEKECRSFVRVKNKWGGLGLKRHPVFLTGFTMIDVVITIVVTVVLVPVVGALLVSGHRAWSNTYNSANKKIKQDAQTVMLTFGSIGRMSNQHPRKLDQSEYGYAIYEISGSSFTVVQPEGNEKQVISEDAVEFIYWDTELDAELMDNKTIGTAYALFYIDGDKLMLDRGPYPPGAVPINEGSKNTSGVTTTCLAENVSADPETDAFSYTFEDGAPQGSVRIHITLTDPDDGETIKVMTSTFMRNIWPR